MTAEELDLLAKEIATLDECDPDYDAHLLHILNAAPALIALAEWAEKALEWMERNKTCETVEISNELLAAYPKDTP